MDEVVFESSRTFALWRATVSHSQVLLRSTKTEHDPSRIDVLFKPTEALKLRTKLDGLRITLASGAEVERLADELDADPSDTGCIYIVESGSFTGFVVAGTCAFIEDDGDYHDPSGLFADTSL